MKNNQALADLSVQIALFDKQHAEIYDLLETLKRAINKGTPLTEMFYGIDMLIDKALFHFKSEEEPMLKFNYDGYQAHKKEHDELMERLTQKRTNLTTSFSVQELRLIIDEVQRWIIKHITEKDKYYTEFLHDQGMA